MLNPDDVVFLSKVVLKNYKSIASCSVKLNPLNFLVGQNGAGKSNFLDALRFVTESVNNSIEYALRERGVLTRYAVVHRVILRILASDSNLYYPRYLDSML